MALSLAVFLAHLAATLALAGLIWTVQLVHYPLFAGVGAEGFAAYEAAHQTRITWLVGPLMLVELGAAVVLAAGLGPEGVPGWMIWTGLALLGVIWSSTALVQVPLHRVLGDGFEASAHARLVATNWVRTAAWTARAGLALAMTAVLLG
jgi:hypothetical protein